MPGWGDGEWGPMPWGGGATPTKSTDPERLRDRGKKETKMVRCARCKFWCNIERDIRAPKGSKLGWGMKYSDTTHAAGDVSDPIVTGGCPQCGTFLYHQ